MWVGTKKVRWQRKKKDRVSIMNRNKPVTENKNPE
jgi:hypothetical protein